MDPELAEHYHPFGSNVLLTLWPHDNPKFNGQRIDHYGPERIRLSVQVEWLEPVITTQETTHD